MPTASELLPLLVGEDAASAVDEVVDRFDALSHRRMVPDDPPAPSSAHRRGVTHTLCAARPSRQGNKPRR